MSVLLKKTVQIVVIIYDKLSKINFISTSSMAKSKFEYVRDFETDNKCLQNCWIVLRLDGKGFHKFTDAHKFEKPNDKNGLDLMTRAAASVFEEFRDICFAFGHSDEYSFVFKKDTNIYNRRHDKILTNVNSLFASSYVFYWQTYFPKTKLMYPPAFDSRIILYPTDENLRDYLSWRQADVHVNNLYNTAFWALVNQKKLTTKQVSYSHHVVLYCSFADYSVARFVDVVLYCVETKTITQLITDRQLRCYMMNPPGPPGREPLHSGPPPRGPHGPGFGLHLGHSPPNGTQGGGSVMMVYGLDPDKAEEALRGTVASEKNELLFKEFGINYNKELELFRKGTSLVRKRIKMSPDRKLKHAVIPLNCDIISNTFWTENQDILGNHPVQEFDNVCDLPTFKGCK